MLSPLLAMEVPPFRLTGTVYGALLNHRPLLEALGDAVNQPPHKGAPREPVLAIKPRNCLAADGDPVVVPAGAAALEIGATLGIVIGRCGSHIDAAQAMQYVAGYTIIADISMPLAGHYRPAVRMKARDGFCPLGPAVVPADKIANPDALAVQVFVDNQLVHSTTTGERIRPVAQLLADVSDFITLQAGDIMMLGVSAQAPQARAGQTVRIEIEGLGSLSNRLLAELEAS